MIKKYLSKFIKSNLQKNLLTYISGNFAVIIISSFAMLLLPKIMSVYDYGVYKTFTLYLSYVSLLHFGLKDGIYLSLCQKKERNIKRDSVYFGWFSLQQVVVATLLLTLVFIFPSNSFLIIILSIASYFSILNTYFDSYAQAFQLFKIPVRYRLIKELTFFSLILAIYVIVIKIDLIHSIIINYKIILILNLCIIILLWTLYFRKFSESLSFRFNFKRGYKLVKPTYQRGSKILVGNFAHQFNTNLDKLLVSSIYLKENFAIYSFGAMFFMMTNLVATNISQVLLPFLYKQEITEAKEKYLKISKYNWIIGIIVFPFFLILTFLIPFFYPTYSDSIKVISLLSIGAFYNLQITISQNNFLKLVARDNLYIRNNLLSVVVLLILGGLIIIFRLPYYYFAVSVSISIFIKYVLNSIFINKELHIKDWSQALLNNLFIWSLYIIILFFTFIP